LNKGRSQKSRYRRKRSFRIEKTEGRSKKGFKDWTSEGQRMKLLSQKSWEAKAPAQPGATYIRTCGKGVNKSQTTRTQPSKQMEKMLGEEISSSYSK